MSKKRDRVTGSAASLHCNVTQVILLIVTWSHLECDPDTYAVSLGVVSRERHPVRYLISPAAYPDRSVVSPEVFLIVMSPHPECRPERYTVSPGASSCSVPDPPCSIILTITRSHPERQPKCYVVAGESFLLPGAKNIFRGPHLLRNPDRYLASPAASF